MSLIKYKNLSQTILYSFCAFLLLLSFSFANSKQEIKTTDKKFNEVLMSQNIKAIDQFIGKRKIDDAFNKIGYPLLNLILSPQDQSDLINYLVLKGALADIPDNTVYAGQQMAMPIFSPLYYAVNYQTDDSKISNTKTLLNNGARINFQAYWGMTIINVLGCNEINFRQLQLFHKKGFNLNLRTGTRDTFGDIGENLLMKFILEGISQENNDQFCFPAIKYLLVNDIDVNAQDEFGNTVLFYLFDFQNTVSEQISPNKVLKLARLLTSHQIDTSIKNKAGFSAIHYLDNNKYLVSSKEYKLIKKFLKLDKLKTDKN